MLITNYQLGNSNYQLTNWNYRIHNYKQGGVRKTPRGCVAPGPTRARPCTDVCWRTRPKQLRTCTKRYLYMYMEWPWLGTRWQQPVHPFSSHKFGPMGTPLPVTLWQYITWMNRKVRHILIINHGMRFAWGSLPNTNAQNLWIQEGRNLRIQPRSKNKVSWDRGRERPGRGVVFGYTWSTDLLTELYTMDTSMNIIGIWLVQESWKVYRGGKNFARKCRSGKEKTWGEQPANPSRLIGP